MQVYTIYIILNNHKYEVIQIKFYENNLILLILLTKINDCLILNILKR